MKKGRKIIVWMLAAAMLLTNLPSTVLAEQLTENTTEEITIEETVPSAEETEAAEAETEETEIGEAETEETEETEEEETTEPETESRLQSPAAASETPVAPVPPESTKPVVEVRLPLDRTKSIWTDMKPDEPLSNDIVSAEFAEKINYRRAMTIEDGKSYLLVHISNPYRVLTQKSGTKGATTGFQNTWFGQGSDYTDCLWKIEKQENGITLQAGDNRYFHMAVENYKGNNGNVNLNLSETPQTLSVLDRGNGEFSFYTEAASKKVCLDRYDSIFSACYPHNENDAKNNWTWNLYEPKYKMTITPCSSGTTELTVGDTVYRITVTEPEETETGLLSKTGQGNGKEITRLTISTGKQYEFGLPTPVAEGETVSWKCTDADMLSMDNGSITALAAGETWIQAVVQNASGEIVRRHEIPVVILPGGTDRLCDLYIDNIFDTTVWYSLNCSTELVEIRKGEALYLSTEDDKVFAIDFFGKPDHGYALTYMSATGSAGQYMSLQDKNDPTQCDFYAKSGAGTAQRSNIYFGEDVFVAMLKEALNLGCDGAHGFTRGVGVSVGGTPSKLTFRSEKLPTVDKQVEGVLSVDGTTYREYEKGMTAKIGEKVYFHIKVTTYAATDRINYTTVTLMDKMQPVESSPRNAYFLENGVATNSSQKTITDVINADAAKKIGQTHDYYAVYEIQEEDIGHPLINDIDLHSSFSSTYTAGIFSDDSTAEAAITVTEFLPEDIVVDFGLPVTVDYRTENNRPKYDLKEGISKNGAQVTVEDNRVTYTLLEPMKEADIVTLRNVNDAEFIFHVYPATSVYYEETFARYYDENGNTGGWTEKKQEGLLTPLFQTPSVTGTETASYGYDDAYRHFSDSAGSVMLSGVRRQYAQFEFTGTGCDIYTRTSPTSGRMSLWLYNAEGRLLRLGMVDTSNTWLQGAEKDCYNTPVYSYRDLEYGSYKVEMRVETGAHGMEIALDGFRVYNTLSEDEGTPVYAMDSEAVPVTAEIRDITIANSTFGSENADLTDISAIYQLSGKIIKAVYDAANNGQGAVILENDGDSNSAITVDADMINNGPKNEIYLTGGQSIAMRFPNPKMIAKLAVGIRSLNGEAVVCKINGKEQPILSSVDMYYKVNANEDGMLVIQNDGDSVIALTKLKVTANPSTETPAVFSVFADADTIAYALMCMSDFVIEEPEVKPEKTDKEEQESEEPKREEPETEEPKRVEPFAEESVSQAVTEPVKKTAEEPASALTEESTAEERQPDAQPEEMQTEEAPVEELSEGNIPVQKDKKTKVSSYWLFGILGITVLAIGAFFIFKKQNKK